jgi:hypothetical protein
MRLLTGFKWLMTRSKMDSSVNSVMDFKRSISFKVRNCWTNLNEGTFHYGDLRNMGYYDLRKGLGSINKRP